MASRSDRYQTADNEEAPRYKAQDGSQNSLITTIFNHIRDIFSISGIITPYILQPLTGFEVYFANMWPFNIGSTFVPEKDIANLEEKVVLVTGGNNGIGKETVLQLAKHQPRKIFLAARTEHKARDAIQSVDSQLSEKVDIEYLPLDLASLPSVKSAAERVISRSDRLDILVLNAGIMAVPPGKTEAGQDIQLGTNHVGHFLLTKVLLPILQKTASEKDSDVRIISVSSEAWNLAPSIDTIISTEKLVQTNPWTRYGASKAANIMFASELARRYPTFTSVSLHPGVIKTDLYLPNQESNFFMRYGLRVLGPLMFQDVPHGALNQLWAAAGAQKSELVNGAYYTPVAKLRTGNKWVNDESAAKALWKWTEEELAKLGY